MKRKIISITLAAALVLGIMPVLMPTPAQAAAGYTEVIAPIYDSAADFSGGVAEVEQDGRWYLADKTGKLIHAFPEYYMDATSKEYYAIVDSRIKPFKDGRALISKYDWELREYVYGMIDTSGNIVVEPKYTEIGEFVDGVANVTSVAYKNGPEIGGVIDRNGREIVPHL